jgi:very-short-patch-repair endonuclease
MTLEHRLFARNLRLAPTDAERRLWQRLRGRQLEGAYFRRQHPLGEYFSDFYCAELKLVVEVDGSQHSESEHDLKRDAWLRRNGYTVLRFWNNEVLAQTTSVVEKILATITALRTSRPPP